MRSHPSRRLAFIALLGALLWIVQVGVASAQSTDETTQQASASQGSVSTRGLSSEQIHAVVGEHRPEVRVCIAEGVGLPMQVDVVVDIVIGPDGRVERASMFESNAGSETVDDCILETIRGFLFPETSNGRAFAVRYPFVFVTGG